MSELHSILQLFPKGVCLECRKFAYVRLRNIVVPRMFYRTDLGKRFVERDRALLEQWGWL